MPSIRKILAAAAAGSLAAVMASAAHANLVTNGGFALGSPQPAFGGFNTLGVGASDLTGWSIASGNIDWINGLWQSSDGDAHSIDLDGSQIGAISQTIATTAGASYLLTFDMSSNPAGGEPTRLMQVTAGAASQLFGFSTPHDFSNMQWDGRSLAFTASGSATTLTFASQNGACCFGPALDNVAVEQTSGGVPEPAAWALMLLGFGGAGYALRRRRAGLAAA